MSHRFRYESYERFVFLPSNEKRFSSEKASIVSSMSRHDGPCENMAFSFTPPRIDVLPTQTALKESTVELQESTFFVDVKNGRCSDGR